MPARGAHRLSRAECRRAGGDHVLDDRNTITGSEGSLDEPARTVRLRFLAHRKRANGWAIAGDCTRVADRVRDRVRAERQSADRVDTPARVTQGAESQRSDEGES